MLVAVALLILLPPIVLPFDPLGQELRARFQPPGLTHLFGTDSLGRDVLVRLSAGGVITLTIGIASTLASLALGLVLGLVSALSGPRVGQSIDAVVTLLMAFPTLLLALFIASLIGTNIVGLIVAIGLANVAVFARLARAETLRVLTEQYYEAARSIGGRIVPIVLRHVLPNLWPSMIVAVTLRASSAVLIEATLSYLGLGLPPPQPTWGTMILDGQRQLESAPWVALAPGFVILLTVLGLNLIGDGLRDILDPRLRGLRTGSDELRAT